MKSIKRFSRLLFYLCYLYIICFVVSCQSENVNINITSVASGTPPMVGLNPTLTTFPETLEPTKGNSATPVALSTTDLTSTIVVPALTDKPTVTPTPSLWLVKDKNPFMVYDYNQSIYLSRPGQLPQWLGYGTTLEGQPWSPDGTHFVFSPPSNIVEDKHVSIVDFTTGQINSIQLVNHVSEIYWSPDGNYLLYISYETMNWLSTGKLMIYNFETGQNQSLTDSLYIYDLGNWSPDGVWFSLILSANEQFDIYRFNITTFELTQVTNTPEVELKVLWSPINDELLVSTIPEYTPAIYNDSELAWTVSKFNINANTWITLLPYVYIPPEPIIWSNNGEAIAYVEQGKLCVLEIETQLSKCLETIDDSLIVTQFWEPSWSKNNQFLAFYGTSPNIEGLCITLFVANLITETIQPIDLAQCSVGPVHWSPNE